MAIRVGIIGSKAGGAQSKAGLCQSRIKGVTLTAVCDLNPEAVRKASAFHGVPGYTDYREMFSRERLDAAVISTPNFAHPQQIIDALEAGLHVYCEKPSAHAREDARRVYEASRRAHTRLQIGYNLRFSLLYVKTHEAARTGWFGDILWCQHEYARIPWNDPQHWKMRKTKSGGHIVHETCHYIDFLRWVVGRPVISVFTAASPIRAADYHDVLDSFHVNLRFEGGAIACLSWTHLYGGPQRRSFTIVGTHGSVFCDSQPPHVKMVYAKNEIGEDGRVRAIRPDHEEDFSGQDWHILGHNTSDCLIDFFQRLLRNEPQAIPPRESYITELICHAAEESALTGTPVNIPPIDEMKKEEFYKPCTPQYVSPLKA